MRLCLYICASILTFIICIFYVYQMFGYMKLILERRNNKIFAAIVPLIISGMFNGLNFFHVPIPIAYILAYIIITLFFYIVFNGTFCQIIFSSGNFVFHLLALRGLILAITALVMGHTMSWLIEDDVMRTVTLAMTFLASFMFLVVFRMCYRDSKVRVLSKNNEQLRLLVISQLFLNISLILLSFSYYWELDVLWSASYHLMASVLIVIIFYVIFNYCGEANLRIENEVMLEVVERQLENQLDNYYAQIEYMNSIRKFKHDYNNIMSTISIALKNGNIDNAKKFLCDIENELEMYNEIYKQYSNNPLIQAILTKVGKRAVKENIDFSAEVVFPNCFVMSDLDICRVFNNIMDNAIEALVKLDVNVPRNLKVKGSKSDGWFTLVQENNFDGDMIMENGNIYTSKEDRVNHGLGIDTVKDIISRSGGIFLVKADRDIKVFTITVHIPYKEDN